MLSCQQDVWSKVMFHPVGVGKLDIGLQLMDLTNKYEVAIGPTISTSFTFDIILAGMGRIGVTVTNILHLSVTQNFGTVSETKLLFEPSLYNGSCN